MSERTGPRLAAVAALGAVLFGFPFVEVFDADALVLGVPVLWGYLFVAWAAVIGLVAWTLRGR